MAPASDWLMTAVGPPPWAIRILDRQGLPLGSSAIIALLEAPDARAKEARRTWPRPQGRARSGLQRTKSPISGNPVAFSVDFSGVQKLDAQGQGFLRRPLDFIPARIAGRLF